MRVLRLFGSSVHGMVFTWGAVAWSTLSGPALGYEAEPTSLEIRAQGGRTYTAPVVDYSTHPWDPGASDLQWELIGSLAVWFVWRARCRRIFEGRAVPPAESIRDFWLELIHTLRGQYDRLQGSSDAMVRRRLAFLSLWGKGPYLSQASGTVRWHYRPPVWLFPPPIV